MKTNPSRQLDALGDPTRRAIFEALTHESLAVGELARAFPISRPAVSQHLRVLADAGLLTVTRDGAKRIYAADPGGIARLRAEVERFWRDALVTFKAAAERKDESPSSRHPSSARSTRSSP